MCQVLHKKETKKQKELGTNTPIGKSVCAAGGGAPLQVTASSPAHVVGNPGVPGFGGLFSDAFRAFYRIPLNSCQMVRGRPLALHVLLGKTEVVSESGVYL